MSTAGQKPVVGIVMGSKNDWEVMKAARVVLEEFGVAHEARAISAHRSTDPVAGYPKKGEARGLVGTVAAAEGRARRIIVDVADAGRRARGDGGGRFGRRQERGAVGGAHSGQLASRTAGETPPILRPDGSRDCQPGGTLSCDGRPGSVPRCVHLPRKYVPHRKIVVQFGPVAARHLISTSEGGR